MTNKKKIAVHRVALTTVSSLRGAMSKLKDTDPDNGTRTVAQALKKMDPNTRMIIYV